MIGNADLTGHRILVVEDDFYAAADVARLLLLAGAELLGPCPDEKTALEQIRSGAPSCALLGADLGDRPSSRVATALRARHIPFVVLTSYEDEALSAKLQGVGHLLKPIELLPLLAALAREVTATDKERLG